MATGPDGKPIKFFRDQRAWRVWLDANHGASAGVWLRFAKKASGKKSVTYAEALDVALCYGWIDGQARGESDEFSQQKFTPRAKRSGWSKRNRDKALAFIKEGLMQPSGLAEVERAQKDGRWSAAYDSPSKIQVPPDLKAALAKNKKADAEFKILDSRNRYAILYRLQTAKRAETRAKRLAQFVAMLAKGGRIYAAVVLSLALTRVLRHWVGQ